MIQDSLDHLGRYSALPHLKEIQTFLASRKPQEVPNGEHEILGRDLFVRVAEYETGSPAEKKFEAHRLYADLQLIASGSEIMGTSFEVSPKPVTVYDAKADIQFFDTPDEGTLLWVSEGQFTVFFPGELHKPGCWVSARSGKVKKLVFKIRMA